MKYFIHFQYDRSTFEIVHDADLVQVIHQLMRCCDTDDTKFKDFTLLVKDDGSFPRCLAVATCLPGTAKRVDLDCHSGGFTITQSVEFPHPTSVEVAFVSADSQNPY